MPIGRPRHRATCLVTVVAVRVAALVLAALAVVTDMRWRNACVPIAPFADVSAAVIANFVNGV